MDRWRVPLGEGRSVSREGDAWRPRRNQPGVTPLWQGEVVDIATVILIVLGLAILGLLVIIFQRQAGAAPT